MRPSLTINGSAPFHKHGVGVMVNAFVTHAMLQGHEGHTDDFEACGKYAVLVPGDTHIVPSSISPRRTPTQGRFACPIQPPGLADHQHEVTNRLHEATIDPVDTRTCYIREELPYCLPLPA